MVTRRTQVLVLALLAGAALFLAHRYWPNEERRVRRQVDRLAACFSKASGESAAMMALNLHGFEQLLGDDVEVDVLNFAGNGSYSAREISSTVARVRAGCRSISLVCRDVSVRFETPETAAATFTARLAVVDADGRLNEDMREITCTLTKMPGGWRFVRFSESSVLER